MNLVANEEQKKNTLSTVFCRLKRAYLTCKVYLRNEYLSGNPLKMPQKSANPLKMDKKHVFAVIINILTPTKNVLIIVLLIRWVNKKLMCNKLILLKIL